MKSENIVAISTSMGAAGVAVIRISGDTAKSVAEKMFKPKGKTQVKDFVPNTFYVGEIICDNFSDFGMCVYFKSPKSFTGEDTIEFHCHGGVAITQGVLKKAISSGARLAKNGEFTQRAFLNGKLSLASAEGLIDMINSQTVSGVKAGYYLYREKLTAEIKNMQDELTDVLSGIDVDMDFPEEDLTVASYESTKNSLNEIITKIQKLLDTFSVGRTLKNGVKVGIVGKPNTGKSSLLNALLKYEKAIVSDTPGTTRDIVEGAVDINGVRFNFCDTAGIRESGDKIEEIGVNLSKRTVKESDIILFVQDGTNVTEEDEKIYELIKNEKHISIINKADKKINPEVKGDIEISALTGYNMPKLCEKLYEKVLYEGIDINGDFLCEQRHYDALLKAKEKLLSAINNIDNVSLDLIAIDIKDGWDSLGEITGQTATEEIINNIFSKFCVGK